MKIVGIATRARITDYSLPYTFCTDSLVDTMAFSLVLFLHVLFVNRIYTFCSIYKCIDIHLVRI